VGLLLYFTLSLPGVCGSVTLLYFVITRCLWVCYFTLLCHYLVSVGLLLYFTLSLPGVCGSVTLRTERIVKRSSSSSFTFSFSK